MCCLFVMLIVFVGSWFALVLFVFCPCSKCVIEVCVGGPCVMMCVLVVSCLLLRVCLFAVVCV